MMEAVGETKESGAKSEPLEMESNEEETKSAGNKCQQCIWYGIPICGGFCAPTRHNEPTSCSVPKSDSFLNEPAILTL